MKSTIKLLFLIAFINLVSSCNERNHPINFYYWKSNVSIGDTEKKYFEELDSKKLYIRFFDIDSDPTEENGYYRASPVAKIKLFDSNILETEYIPVVFITNRTFLDMNSDKIEHLAKNTYSLIKEIQERNDIKEIKEIQIDCDWTESTKSSYFNFLKQMQKLSNIEITSTIRLHQVKFKDSTGVPPIKKGYLMCYATSNPNEEDVENSILDINLLKDYTKNINDYPIKLDIALPIYSWGIVTNHLGKIKIANAINEENLDPDFFKKIKDNLYEVQDDLFFKGLYLNKGFTIRLENISPSLLKEARDYLDSKIKDEYGIVYYHLDEVFLQRFSIADLK